MVVEGILSLGCQRKRGRSEPDLRLVRPGDFVVLFRFVLAKSQGRKRVAIIVVVIVAHIRDATNGSRRHRHRHRRCLVNVARHGGPFGGSDGGRRPGQTAATAAESGKRNELLRQQCVIRIHAVVGAHDLPHLVHRFFHQLICGFDEAEGGRLQLHRICRQKGTVTRRRLCFPIALIGMPSSPLLSARGGVGSSTVCDGRFRGPGPLRQRILLPVKVLLLIGVDDIDSGTITGSLGLWNGNRETNIVAIVVGIGSSLAACFCETAGVALLFRLLLLARFGLAFPHCDVSAGWCNAPSVLLMCSALEYHTPTPEWL